jgi:uncharacterized protein DUF4349
MSRRRLTILVFAVSVASVGAISCAQDAPPSVEPANQPAADAAGFGVAGSDAAVPAPLSGYGPMDQTAARERAMARRAAARRAAGTVPTAGKELAATTASAAQVPARSGPLVQLAQAGAMLIRTGQAVVEVDSVQVGIARVRRLAQETGALVANTIVQTGREQQRSASLELRIPSDRFDAVVNGLAPIGKVESVSISAQDVGEEFVDLSARVANARRLEARLIELLASRTGRLADVLSVERELARVREEIERYEGRLRYLQAHVSVSSLTVVVHEPPLVVATHPGENVIGEAFVEAWRRFVLLTAGIIASLGVVIPVAAIGVGALVLGRRYLAQKPRAVEQA